jgi:hypothetical protein
MLDSTTIGALLKNALEERSASGPAPRSPPALLLLTHARDRTYEAYECWTSGHCQPHLIRSGWLTGTGLSRELRTPFGIFSGAGYEPATLENFLEGLIEWVLTSRQPAPRTEALIAAFLVVASGEHFYLNLPEEDYSRPFGLQEAPKRRKA